MVIILRGAVEQRLLVEGVTTVVVRNGVTGIDPDDLIVVPNGSVVVLLVMVSDPARVEGGHEALRRLLPRLDQCRAGNELLISGHPIARKTLAPLLRQAGRRCA